MDTSNINTEVYAVAKAQTLADFKNAVLITSLTVNGAILFAWIMNHAAQGTL